jgi:DNA-binding MarR family transcriptional regulator
MARSLPDTLDQILRLTTLLAADARRGLGRVGLTLPRAHLAWLLHHEGPRTQRELADALGVTPRNVTGLVDGLADTGFVTREPHPTDRRALLVSLTPHGARVLAEMDSEHKALAQLLLGDLSAAQLDGFADGLAHVIERLEEALA